MSFHRNRRPAEIKPINIYADPVSKRLSVESPFNEEFVTRAKTIGGRWDGTSRRWTFPAENLPQVTALCMAIFGTSNGLPNVTREMLESQLATHLAAIVGIQEQLDKMDEAQS